MDRREHGAGFGVEAILPAVVADLVDGGADDVLEVNVGAGGDFTRNDREAGGDERFARDTADGILSEDRIEDGIRNLVGDLVGMPLGHRLRREKIAALTAHATPLAVTKPIKSTGFAVPPSLRNPSRPVAVIYSMTTFWQKVEGTTEQAVAEIRRLVAEGNVRRVVVKQHGKTVAEFPVTVGVIGAVLAPMAAAIGALAAILTDCSIEIERAVDTETAVATVEITDVA